MRKVLCGMHVANNSVFQWGFYMSRLEAEALRKRLFWEYMKTYEFHISNGMYALAVSDLEQALQLYVKAKLLDEGIAYPKTHSVRTLLELLAKVRRDNMLMELIERYSVELKLLEEAYISSRYVATEFRLNEVLRVKKALDELLKHV